MDTLPQATSTVEKVFCPYCFHTLTGSDYFCPFCGKQIKEKPINTSLSKQITLYAISLLLPPAGLWPAFKYLSSKDPNAKKIGLLCIVLTIISVIVTGIVLSQLINSVNTQINDQLNNGLLGY